MNSDYSLKAVVFTLWGRERNLEPGPGVGTLSLLQPECSAFPQVFILGLHWRRYLAKSLPLLKEKKRAGEENIFRLPVYCLPVYKVFSLSHLNLKQVFFASVICFQKRKQNSERSRNVFIVTQRMAKIGLEPGPQIPNSRLPPYSKVE